MKFSIYVETDTNPPETVKMFGIQSEWGLIIPNVSLHLERVDSLVDMLNKSDADPGQVEEIVEDFEGYWIMKDLHNW